MNVICKEDTTAVSIRQLLRSHTTSIDSGCSFEWLAVGCTNTPTNHLFIQLGSVVQMNIACVNSRCEQLNPAIMGFNVVTGTSRLGLTNRI